MTGTPAARLSLISEKDERASGTVFAAAARAALAPRCKVIVAQALSESHSSLSPIFRYPL
jgi:hypothetical protein